MTGARAVTHHPDEELLVAYAAGASDEAVALVIATHLAFCPACRRMVGTLERAAGEMMDALEPVALSAHAAQSVMGRLDVPEKPSRRRTIAGGDRRVPEPLRSYAGNMSSGWLPLGPGLSQRPLFRRGRSSVRLIRAAPGYGAPLHTHEGRELTLVLSGGFSDTTGQYGPGDLQTTSPEITHHPVADPGEYCVNLAVTDAPLRFVSWLPSLIGKVFGI